MSSIGRTLLFSTVIVISGFTLLYFIPGTDKHSNNNIRDNKKREQLISVMRKAASDPNPLFRENPSKIANIQRTYLEKDQSSESNK